MTFATNLFWSDLAENGKVRIVGKCGLGGSEDGFHIRAAQMECYRRLRDQLHREAKAEGVQLSIKIRYTNRVFITLYAYLRKQG